MLHVDDEILAGLSKSEIDEAIQLAAYMADKGDLSNYFGVNTTHMEDRQIELTQPHVLKRIINDLTFQQETPKGTPTESTKYSTR